MEKKERERERESRSGARATRTASGGGDRREPGKDEPGGAGGAGEHGGVAEPAESQAAAGSAHPHARLRLLRTSQRRSQPGLAAAAKEEGCFRGVSGRQSLPGAHSHHAAPAVLGKTAREDLAPSSLEPQKRPTP